MTDDDIRKVVPLSYRTGQIEQLLQNHEERITENERFRLQMWGVIKFIGFILGSGFGVILVSQILL